MSNADNDDYPPFRLGRSRFDQSNFQGRLRHFLDITDPRTLFTSKVELEHSRKLLDQFKTNQLPDGVTNKELWEAQKIKQAIIHPDTGEKIFMPFRMSVPVKYKIPVKQILIRLMQETKRTMVIFLQIDGFVPFGSPIVVGLLLPNQTLTQMIFWQWLNQSHNACVNYSNRNATKKTPTSRFLLGYFGAVTSAVGIAVGLSLLIRRANNLSPAMKLIVQKFVPFPAVATASTCNVILMRNNELYEGIEIFDEAERVVGTSKVAAKKALKEMAVTRMILPAPILLIPPVVMTFMERTRFLRRNPRMHLPINAIVTTLSFAFALPIAIALFPQVSSIKKEILEPEIQKSTPDERLFYNKGL